MAHIQDRRKQGKGWIARYTAPDGSERSQAFTRKVDAQAFLDAQEVSKRTGDWVDPRRGVLPVEDWSKRWFATTASLKPKTRASYTSLLNSRVLPTFGKLPLNAVDSIAVEEWVAGMTAKNLSASRVRQAYYVLDAMFSSAVRSRYIARNPCADVTLPRLPQRDDETMVVLDETAIRVLAEAMAPRYRTFVYALAYTGCRFGEMVALRRRRCVLLRRQLDVAESLAEVSGKFVFGPPKSHRRRTIKVPAFLAEMLAAELARTDGGDDALVFTAPGGSPIRHTNFRRHFWLPAIKAAGLPDAVTPHSLRHSCASMLIADGVPLPAIQEQLGHASPDITLRVYSHLFPRDLQLVADALERRFQGAALAPGRDGDGTGVVRVVPTSADATL